jgi:hypothetical protein
VAADHASAVLAALQANPNLTAFRGPVPKGTAPPYVAVYTYLPHEDRSKLNQESTDTSAVTAITHSVASSQAGVEIVRRNVRTALLDQHMTVDGTQCSRITHEVGLPADWDDSSGVVVMAAVDEWDYTARPA